MVTVKRTKFLQPQSQWMQVNHYLRAVLVEGMRKNLCIGCGFAKLYDKNNKQYLILRTHTLDQAKAIVEEIRLTNTQTEQP